MAANIDIRPSFPQLAVLSHANAAGAEELGLGVTMPIDDLTPAALRAAVEEVASSRVRANLAGMRRDIDSGGGAVAAADAPENHLAR